MKSPQEEDPLRSLSKKALRRLARKHKIKHFYRKSPSSLRRAIRRAQSQQTTDKIKAPHQLTVPPAPLNPEAAAEQRQQETRKAYEEHRLRYLYAPSRFVHKGVHEEYILEKDEELELPEFYREDELVAMPIDPFRFYVYWDFAEETLYDVRSWLAEDTPFLLRIHDVTSLVFDGKNAHYSWETPCHPLSREWYLDSPVSGRNVLVELGVLLNDGFRPILSSNTIFIPPETVSELKRDVFAHFVPVQTRPQDRLRPMPPPDQKPVVPKPETSAHVFFQAYQPSPVQFNPIPAPKAVRPREMAPPPVRPLEELFPPIQTDPTGSESRPTPEPFHSTLPDSGGWREPQYEVVAQPQASEGEGGEEFSESELRQHLQAGGQERLQEWLGVPHEIRWLSDLPAGMSPLFFEHWISDPYDRAVMISYSIWPWELSEYLPLGASDWTLRKFLGASLFSWYRPGGSERMYWWQRPLGASEWQEWLRPQGASERSWSGSLQTDKEPRRSAWYLWPPRQSGKGLFG